MTYHRTEYNGTINHSGCRNTLLYEAIIEACFSLAIPPHRVAKFVALECAAAPAAFLGRSHAVAAPARLLPAMAAGSCRVGDGLLTLCLTEGESFTPSMLLSAWQSGAEIKWLHLLKNSDTSLIFGKHLEMGRCGLQSDRLVAVLKTVFCRRGFSYVELEEGSHCDVAITKDPRPQAALYVPSAECGIAGADSTALDKINDEYRLRAQQS